MKGLIFDGQIKRREMGRGKENYNSQLIQEFSVTRWPICLLNFGHLQQWKFTPWHLKFAKLSSKFCLIVTKIYDQIVFAQVAKIDQIWSHCPGFKAIQNLQNLLFFLTAKVSKKIYFDWRAKWVMGLPCGHRQWCAYKN